MEDSNNKSIRFSKAVNDKLQDIASRLGLSKREMLVQMTEYFYRTRKDPADYNDQVLKNTLIKSHKTYVGFIKSQEDLLLIPIKQAVDRMIANQKEIVKYFNEQVPAANKNLLANQSELQKTSKDIGTTMKVIAESLEQKAQLKQRFLQILTAYVRSREELGSFKGREKEELLEQTKRHIEHL